MSIRYQDWQCSGCGQGHLLLVERAPDGSEQWNLVEERTSLGLYAGRYHEPCWQESGYRQEGPAGFNPMDAGECYEEDLA